MCSDAQPWKLSNQGVVNPMDSKAWVSSLLHGWCTSVGLGFKGLEMAM